MANSLHICCRKAYHHCQIVEVPKDLLLVRMQQGMTLWPFTVQPRRICQPCQ